MKTSYALERRLYLFKFTNCVPICVICSILLHLLLCTQSVHARLFNKEISDTTTQYESPLSDSLSSTIFDELNHPIAGATIKVKGTQIHETSDDSGHFTIATKSLNGIQLEISYVGFENQVIDLTNGLPSKIILKKKADNNEEVIVIAYGTTNRKNLSTAISRVGAKDFANKPVATAAEAMVGVVPGINIQQGTGEPGQQPQIRIRGMGSLSAGNSPLYVIDGIPISGNTTFGTINPQDIENVEVLKDAAASAIYGSRGGNGVLLVTTKKGNALGPIKINVDGYYGFQNVAKKIKVLKRDDYVSYVKDAFVNGGKTVPPMLNNVDSLPDTDWQSVIFKTAPMSNINFSLAGGSDKALFFASANYLCQDGILKNTDYKRGSIRINSLFKPASWIKIGINMNPTYSYSNLRPASGTVNSGTYNSGFGPNPVLGAPITLARLMPPIFPIYQANGDYTSQYNYNPYLATVNQLLFNGQTYSPLAALDLLKDHMSSFNIFGNTFIEIQPIPHLTLKTNFGGEYGADQRQWFVPATLMNNDYTLANLSNPILANVKNSLSKQNRSNWVWENTANYNISLGRNNIDLLAGYSAQKARTEIATTTARSGTATSPVVEYPTNATTIDGIPSYTANSLVSMFGRVQYNYDSRYIFSAAVRRDGSSRFGSNNRYAVFPSFSAAWRIIGESFMEGIRSGGVLSDLKIRGSWGKTGNFNIGDFSWQGYQQVDNYILGTGSGNVAPGFGQGTFSQNNLTWETNKQTDLGLELGFINNRIQLSVDYYNRKTENLLLSKNVPLLIGFTTSVLTNTGSIQNKGWEFNLVTQNFIKKFNWTSTFNISINKNRILSLVDGTPILSDVVSSPGYQNAIRQVVGGQLGDFYGYRQVGIYMNQAEVTAGPVWATGGSQPGDIKYSDENKDGIIDSKDIVKIGSPLAKFIYGSTQNFSYNKFSLAIVLQGSYGGVIANAIDRYSNTFVGGHNPTIQATKRWRSESDPGDGWTPRAYNPGNASPSALSQFSTRNLFSASFFRVRSINIGYDVKDAIFKAAKSIKTARVYVSAQNLLTIAKYPGYSPEANMWGAQDGVRLGVDQGAYPPSRTFVFGFNLGL